MSAHTRGPLAGLQTIPRLTAVTGLPAPVPPEGRNYSVGVGFGDKRLTVGLRAHANNVSGSTLDIMNGPQYVSGAAAMDLRYAAVQWKGVSAIAMLAPSYTLLVDSTRGTKSYGEGIRYGGGLEVSVSAFRFYADAYQEKLMFQYGPAQGLSTRTGVTLGMAFQP